MKTPPTCTNPSDAGESPAGRWRLALEAWAIPEAIRQAAPESPWGFPTSLFSHAAAASLADPEPTPSRHRALDLLSAGATVLDVGAGGGAASLPLAPPVGWLVAVDESEAMLASFAAAAEERGVTHTEVAGRWPDIAPTTPVAEVVVCHHVTYNVADLVPFVTALDEHARRRVVIEMTERHPQSDLAPLWRSIHGLDRPSGPSADDAAAVVAALGYDVHLERFERASLWDGAPRGERVAFARRRLCVGPEYDAEIGAYLEERLTSGEDRRALVTLWWDRRC